MPVVVRSDANGNVVLPARAVLAGLPKQLPSRHRELGLRHPLGTYNTSVAVVAKRVTRVVNLLRTVVPETGPGTRNHQNKRKHCLSPMRPFSRA